MNFTSLLLLSLMITSCATNISGRVISADAGKPITQGKVNISLLEKSEGQTSYVVDIDEEGAFSTDADLADGEYLVETLIPGYRTQSTKIDVRETQEVTMQVVPLQSVKRSAIGAHTEVEVGRGEGGALITPPEM